MNIIVLGAGAIGSFYGAKLSTRNNVLLIGRKPHVDAINKHGLKISGLETKTYWLKSATKINVIMPNTLIVLTTKARDSQKAVQSIKNFIRKDTIILCVQNGLYTEKIVKTLVGKQCLVLRAITNFGAYFLKPGTIKYTQSSYTSIEKSPKSSQIADNLTACGLNAYVSGNLKKDMWKKLIFNCMVNPLTAILRMENRGITKKELDPIKAAIIQECRQVAKKDNVTFDFDFGKAVNKEFKNSRNISSMQQDLIKGKKTEIDYLNGAVVHLGKRYGITCPVNESLVSMIKFLEQNKK